MVKFRLINKTPLNNLSKPMNLKKSMLAHTLRSYIFGLFKKIELGVHVIQLSKQELQTITKAHLDYSTLFMDKIEVKIDPQMNFLNNLSNLRSLSKLYVSYKL